MTIRNVFLAMAIFGLIACETVEGFGEDVEAGGQLIQDTSEDIQRGG
jgi:predicted small secreted protein